MSVIYKYFNNSYMLEMHLFQSRKDLGSHMPSLFLK